MAVSTTTGTYLSNLFDPEVISDIFEEKLMEKIKLAPLAMIDSSLEGRPGSTVILPFYEYIGDATQVGEGADITIKQLSQKTKEVKIVKVGNGVQITDEAALSGYGDPIDEATNQLVKSVASKVDNMLLASLDANTTMTAIKAKITANDIADALVKFGEDIDGDKVLLINADAYAELRKSNSWIPNTEISANMIIRGAVGMVHGCQVILTDRIKTTVDETGKIRKTNFHIVKPGALAIFAKRDTFVEHDRDIVNKSTVITVDKHFAPYLLDATKAVRIEQTITSA